MGKSYVKINSHIEIFLQLSTKTPWLSILKIFIIKSFYSFFVLFASGHVMRQFSTRRFIEIVG